MKGVQGLGMLGLGPRPARQQEGGACGCRSGSKREGATESLCRSMMHFDSNWLLGSIQAVNSLGVPHANQTKPCSNNRTTTTMQAATSAPPATRARTHTHRRTYTQDTCAVMITPRQICTFADTLDIVVNCRHACRTSVGPPNCL